MLVTALPGHAQDGTAALVYCGDSSFACSASEIAPLVAALTGAGASEVRRETVLPSDLSAYRVLFLYAPNSSSIATSTFNRIEAFYDAGGYVVAASDNSLRGITQVNNLNNLSTRFGLGNLYSAGDVACFDGDPLCTSVPVEAVAHPLLSSVNTIQTSCGGVVSGETVLARFGGFTVAAVSGRLLALGDTQMLSSTCNGFADGNDQFWANVWTWANPNVAPTAGDDAFVIDEDTTLTDTLVGGDEDLDGDTLTYEVFVAPPLGDLSLSSNGAFTYTPPQDFAGDVDFVYRVRDRLNATDTATVTIEVVPVNDPPSVHPDEATIDEEGTLVLDVVANDSDVEDGRPTVSAVVSATVLVDVTVEPDGRLRIVGRPDATGTETFVYRAVDSDGLAAEAIVTIDVINTNDRPIVFGDDVSVVEDGVRNGTVSAIDPDDDALVYDVVDVPAFGNVVLDPVTGAYSYRPVANYNGSDSFSFVADDGLSTSAPGVVTIEVTPVNDAPVPSSPLVSTLEDIAVGFTLPTSDIDLDDLTWALTSAPLHGEITAFDEADGSGTYTPDLDFVGLDTVRWSVTDGTVTVTSTIRFNVGGDNDTPFADDITLFGREDTAQELALIGFDPDGDSLTTVIDTEPVHGTLIDFDATTGSVTYLPDPDWNGVEVFTFFVTDGEFDSRTATVSLDIAAVNDAPAITAQTVSVDEDTDTWIDLVVADVDSETVTLVVLDGPAIGAILDVDSPGARIHYLPDLNASGRDTVLWTANDGQTNADPVELAIDILPLNDAPVFTSPDDGTVLEAREGEPFEFCCVAFVDPDGDSGVELSASGLPVGATLDSASGTISMTPTWADAGTWEVTLLLNDGAASTTMTLFISVIAADSDNDGVPDGREDELGLDPGSDDSDGDRISDADELGDVADPRDSDDDGDIDALDTDADNDGIDDAIEAGDADLGTPPVDTDGDGIPDAIDPDSDNDDAQDGNDNCRLVANPDQADVDDDGAGDACDPDQDGDGVPNDIEELRGTDPASADSDSDTISDGDELGDDFARLDSDDDGTIDALDDDSDNDTLLDVAEAGDDDISTPPVDTDGDGTPDFRDPDSDNDGIDDDEDVCRLVENINSNDQDRDGTPDACDDDEDGDGADNDADNCPLVANADQSDRDDDGVGDVCDGDSDPDGDGVTDADDNCPDVSNPGQGDRDEDGIGDDCDPSTDVDRDGVDDISQDNCPDVANATQADMDADGIGDDCDPDSDGDGIDDDDDDCIGLADICGGSGSDDGGTKDSGCNCRTASPASSGGAVLVAIAAVAVLRRRRAA